jgi:hypothetical protein
MPAHFDLLPSEAQGDFASIPAGDKNLPRPAGIDTYEY